MEHAAHDGQRFRRGDAQTVDDLLLDSSGGQCFVELRSCTVNHDGR